MVLCKPPVPGCRCLSCKVAHLTQSRLVIFVQSIAAVSQAAEVVQRNFDVDTCQACCTLCCAHIQHRSSGSDAFQIGAICFLAFHDQRMERRSEIRPENQHGQQCGDTAKQIIHHTRCSNAASRMHHVGDDDEEYGQDHDEDGIIDRSQRNRDAGKQDCQHAQDDGMLRDGEQRQSQKPPSREPKMRSSDRAHVTRAPP